MSATAPSQPTRAGLSPRRLPTPMSFPPPPTTESKPGNKKKPVPLALNFKSQSRQNSGSGSDSSSINSISLQKAPKPILKRSIKSTKRTRQWILLLQLILAFIILILSVILAYCAALPHSDNISGAQASALASTEAWAGPVTSTLSFTSTTATGTPSSAPVTSSTYTFSPGTLQPPRRHISGLLSTRDTTTSPSSDTQIDTALAQDASDHARFSTPGAQAALTFYTATLPVLTMLHTAVELLISLARPETSQHTKLGDKLLFRNPTVTATSGAAGILQRRRTGTLLSFTVSALLILGWSVMQLFTLNCEIVTFGRNGESACPVQIRGHRMGGISELSVGKVVLGFVVILGYVAYCAYLVKVVGVFGGRGSVSDGRGSVGVGGFKRRARFAAGQAQGDRESGKEGSFTVVKVELRGNGGAV